MTALRRESHSVQRVQLATAELSASQSIAAMASSLTGSARAGAGASSNHAVDSSSGTASGWCAGAGDGRACGRSRRRTWRRSSGRWRHRASSNHAIESSSGAAEAAEAAWQPARLRPAAAWPAAVLLGLYGLRLCGRCGNSWRRDGRGEIFRWLAIRQRLHCRRETIIRDFAIAQLPLHAYPHLLQEYRASCRLTHMPNRITIASSRCPSAAG
jgi:hypothetical protein